MTHTTTAALLGLVLSSTVGQAALVTFSTMRSGNVETDSVVSDQVNTGLLTTVTNNTTDTARTTDYTVTGLDLDGIGGTDDSIVVTIAIDALGGNFNINSGNIGIDGAADASNRIDTLGQGVTFSLSGINVTLGNGGATSHTFDKFTRVEFTLYGVNDRYEIIGTGSTDTASGNANPSDEVTFDTPSESFTVKYATGGDGFRVRAIDFSVTVDVIPEPSSSALLGLGGLALILRRRK